MSNERRRSGVSRRTALPGTGSSGIATLAMHSEVGLAAHDATPAAGQGEANKDLVRRFYDAFYTARRIGDTRLIDAVVAPDYIQHEAGVPLGRDGLKSCFAMPTKPLRMRSRRSFCT
jgi:hypothetical protein